MAAELQIPFPVGAVASRFLDDAGTTWWMDRLRQRPGVQVSEIGKSRGGRPLYGLQVGNGAINVSITAGAHADEPAGPMAACALAWWLGEPEQSEWRKQFTFMICPQVNPDGAEANRPWFAAVPDMETYLRHVRREGPGDDVEFGYPGNGKGPLRPENAAAASFLSGRAPYQFHASLHSMGFAEGAWFLISKNWADRSKDLQDLLKSYAAEFGFQLHDIQRHGDKGFTRIARGFCTTPTSTAMRQHFLDADEPAMADKFHFSSMEFIASLGGDPLQMVSEVPYFAIGGGWQPGSVDVAALSVDAPAPEPGSTLYEKSRDRIKEHVAAGDLAGAAQVAKDYGVIPVPFASHAGLQVQMVLSGLSHSTGK